MYVLIFAHVWLLYYNIIKPKIMYKSMLSFSNSDFCNRLLMGTHHF